MTADEAVDTARQRDVSSQIRGSGVLMLGRMGSIGVNLAVQALIARGLTKDEFGHFSYALALVTMFATFITLGIDRAVPRFVAMYDERREYGNLVGTLVIQLSTILTLGLFAVVAVLGLQSWIADVAIGDAQVTAVLVILVFLAPLQALDQLAVAMFAVYAKPSAIFVRRYLFTPGMRLLVVALLVAGDRGAEFLAVGYVVTGLVGVILYGVLLWPMLTKTGVIAEARASGISLPWRSVLGYSLPLLSSDLLFSIMNTSDVVLLERYRDSEAVAAYRVVLPAAKLNQFVMASFALLFVPLASRFLERRDRQGMTDLYWRTAAWIAVATFPLFAITFALADDLSAAMFGEVYRSSGTYLSLLALGYYFNAALGFNGLTVKTAGRIRYTIVISLVAAVMNIALNIVLIPEFGPLGAAVGTLVTLVVHNLLKQFGLRFGTGVSPYPVGMLRPYVFIVVATVLLFAARAAFDPPLALGILMVAVVSLGLIRVTRTQLDVLTAFPEVGKIPLARKLLGGST